MDLFEAMKAHAVLKVQCSNAIRKKDTLDVAATSTDKCCELGKWLHGQSKIKFGRLKSHADCVAWHAKFHQEAGKIARVLNQKKYEEAEDMLDFDTPFALASKNFAIALTALKKESGM